MSQKLYIYSRSKNIQKEGILSPQLNTQENLRHYFQRAKSKNKKDILNWLDSTFPNRSKSISVLTERIPLDIERYDLAQFMRSSNLYQIPSIQELKKLNLVSDIYQAKKGKEKFIKVNDIDYSPIEWPTDKDGWGFTGVKHYNLVLTKGKIPAKYCKKISMYQPPYTLEQIKANYPEQIYKKLKNDKVHSWRAETGIELIHKEPTLKQLLRIWFNWNLMTDEQQDISDKKSKQLFGLCNFENFNCLIREYDLEQVNSKSLVKQYNQRDMKQNNIQYIHLSRSSSPLVMRPRIPKNTMRSEDSTIKRICFSTSILQASGAINTEDIMYIHVPKEPLKYVLSTDEIKNKVQDAPNTGQVWVLDDKVETKVIGKVHFKSYWKDQRFNFPLIYTDNRGVNICTYFRDYQLELFKPLLKTFQVQQPQQIKFDIDPISKTQFNKIDKFYRCYPTKKQNISNPVNQYIFLTPYKAIATCFLNKQQILDQLLPTKNVFFEYSPFKEPNKRKLKEPFEEIEIYTNYELTQQISGEMTGYIQEINKSSLDVQKLSKINTSNQLEYIYTDSIKNIKNTKYTIKYKLKYLPSLKKKYGKVIYKPIYFYYPLTKKDIENQYISTYKLPGFNTTLGDLKQFINNSEEKYLAFIKVPILLQNKKTDEFYIKCNYQNRILKLEEQERYSFLFNDSDIRYFQTQTQFMKIFNKVMREL